MKRYLFIILILALPFSASATTPIPDTGWTDPFNQHYINVAQPPAFQNQNVSMGIGIGSTAPPNSTSLAVNGTVQTGIAGSTLGSVLLAGNTSGLITVKSQAAAGTYNFNLPITAGSSGQALLSGGGSSTAMTWGTVATGSGGTPTCGAGCSSVTAGSTDLRGSMVSGSSVSAVTLNFSGTLASAPFCTISDSNTSATADISSISTSALTVSLASALTSVTIYWNCPL